MSPSMHFQPRYWGFAAPLPAMRFQAKTDILGLVDSL